MKSLAITTFALALLGAGTALADTTINNNTNITVNNTETNINCTQCNIYMPGTPVAAPEKKEFRIKVCNESNVKISVAMGYRLVADAMDWHFQGWYKIDRGQCRSMQVEAKGRSELEYIYHAHSSDGTVTWGKNGRFRVPNTKFDYTYFGNSGMRIEGDFRLFTLRAANLKDEDVVRLTGG